jgi:hypothetical protein
LRRFKPFLSGICHLDSLNYPVSFCRETPIVIKANKK